ncbi:MAG TPA: restriction endonuclease subunit S, partial [Brumimicrobium sp.]|nr:restriction endonuclease subunit S [Brumimicrobium sp.]
WIGEIPGHWTIATVGRLTNLGRGRVISAIEIAENEGEYPVYSSQTENNGVMGRLNSFDFEGEYVTWTTDGANAGTVFYREGKFNCTNVCGTIQPKKWEQIDLKFLPYYLNLGTRFSVRLDINPKLMNNMMAKIPLVIPPKPEQTAIAAYLDRKTAEIDELIADKKRLLELYEEEKAAIINQAVTKGINPNVPLKDSGIEWMGEIPEHWEVKRFKYYFNIITEKVEEDLPKIGLENIESKSGRFIETDTEFAGQGVRFRPKDILFGKLRPYLAKVWLSNFDGQAVGDFYVFRSKQDVIPEFAKYRILDSSFIEVTNSSTYGSKMPRVSWEFIADLPIAFPKIQEQESIVQHIEVECSIINAKKAKTEKLIELLTEYRTALISEVVTGKIKVIGNG